MIFLCVIEFLMKEMVKNMSIQYFDKLNNKESRKLSQTETTV